MVVIGDVVVLDIVVFGAIVVLGDVVVPGPVVCGIVVGTVVDGMIELATDVNCIWIMVFVSIVFVGLAVL